MKRWKKSLGQLAVVACVGCAGSIDDPASFEDYAAQSRGAGLDAGLQDAAPAQEAAAAEDTATGSEPDASEADAGAQGGGPVACDFKALVQAKCGSSNCHGGPSSATGVDLTSEGVADRLKNRSGSGSCSTKRMIDSETPEQSALYLLVSGNSCGIRMPVGNRLDVDEQACILQWIEGL
jgi:hypothetical protein